MKVNGLAKSANRELLEVVQLHFIYSMYTHL